MAKKIKIKSKSQEEAVKKALLDLNVSEEDIEVVELEAVSEEDIEVVELEAPSKGFLGFIGSKEGLYEITVIERETDVAKSFIETLLKNAKVNADVEVKQEDNLIKVNIKGDEAACLIGRRGDTLDSIQFLTGLALNKINKDSHTRVLVDIENYREKREESLIRYANKMAREDSIQFLTGLALNKINKDSHTRVLVDIENYREKREESLIRYANKMAREVAKTKKTKKLDYMNPYERRIIHSALQNDRYVITYSEGTDPYRRLVIEYKR